MDSKMNWSILYVFAVQVAIACLGAFAAAVRLSVERHFLIFLEAGQARGLNRGDVNKDVRTAIVRLDEAEALRHVEPLDLAVFAITG